MAHLNDKPKRAITDFTSERQRSVYLTLFLAFTLASNLLLVLGLLFFTDNIRSYDPQIALSFGFSVFVLIASSICAWGLWNWQRWGYDGLISLYILGSIFSVITGNFQVVAGIAINIGLLYFLMKDKMHYLD